MMSESGTSLRSGVPAIIREAQENPEKTTGAEMLLEKMEKHPTMP